MSLDDNLIEELRNKDPNINISGLVNDLLNKELGKTKTIKDWDTEINELNQQIIFAETKRNQLLDIEKQEIMLKTQEQQDIIKTKELKQAERVQYIKDLFKDIPEIAEINKEMKEQGITISNTQYLLSKVDILRAKYPALKFGLVQLRERLINTT